MSQLFISYRRDGGNILGQLLSYRLKESGYDVFFDTQSMKLGRFDDQIMEQIRLCDGVLLLLTPHALDRCANDGDFVRLEISLALELQKKIIPVMVEGFSFPPVLPEEIDGIRLYQALKADVLFFEAFYTDLLRRLEEYVGKLDLYSQMETKFHETFSRKSARLPGNLPKPLTEEEHKSLDSLFADLRKKGQESEEPEKFDEFGFSSLRSFRIKDLADMYSMCFCIKVTTLPDSGEPLFLPVLLRPAKELPWEDGSTLRIFAPEVERNERLTLVFLTVKNDCQECLLNGGEFINGHLTVRKKPGHLPFTKINGTESLPEGWIMEEMLDATELTDQTPEEKTYSSEYSLEKLQYVFIDPVEKKVIQPKLRRGKDGKLMLDLRLILRKSYIIINVS